MPDSDKITDLLSTVSKELGFLLRYVIAGLVGLIVIGALNDNGFEFLMPGGKEKSLSLPLTIILALPSGTLAYLLSRAVVFPICWFVLCHLFFDDYLGPNEWAVDLDRKLSKARAEMRKNADERWKADHLKSWADQVHALYCIAIVVLFATWFHYLLKGSGEYGFCFCFAVALFITAGFHHFRYLLEEVYITQVRKAGDDGRLNMEGGSSPKRRAARTNCSTQGEQDGRM